MDQRIIEIDEVRMSFTGAGQESGRAERVSRLVFEHLHAMMDGSLRDLEQSAEVNFLQVGPIRVSSEANDETIARESAAEICRALLQAT